MFQEIEELKAADVERSVDAMIATADRTGIQCRLELDNRGRLSPHNDSIRDLSALKVMTDKRRTEPHKDRSARLWHQPTGPATAKTPEGDRRNGHGRDVG